MTRWLRRLGWAVLVLVGPVVVLGGSALAWYASRVLPVVDGSLAVIGAAQPLRIERDAHGIPTIHAASFDDGAFGLGFVHAQDRLWQLETHKRIGAGRLAEAFGSGALENDRFLRALGVRRAAAAQWHRLPAQSKRLVEAYTAGVNAFLRDHMKARPPEFLVLGVQPEPWQPVDTLAWTIMMAYDLGANWATELLRMRLALKLPVARIDQLMPPYPGDKPLPLADYAALYRELKVDANLGTKALLQAPLPFTEGHVEGMGSNNWAVAGARSATGKPLLANDPHLKLTAPPLWYFARIVTPQGKVAGASMPGVPMIVLGQNDRLAWGFTNTAPDVQDLYLERIDPDDPARYRTPDGWAAFERFDEVIKVRGGADVKLTARATRHGPVISDAGTGAELTGPRTRPTYAIAMRWTALDADADPIAPGIAFNRARSVAEFVDASAGWVAPMQNMLVADRDGAIGFVAAGRVPLRKPEHDLKGQVPAPGWDARYDWAGFVDVRQTPRDLNPARGWLATANQKIHADDYPHYLTNEWAAPYRQQRIEQLLQARPTHDLDSFAAMQADVKSLGAAPLLPALKQAQASHLLAPAARHALSDFDGTMDGDAAAPLIFWAFVRQLTIGVFADELGGDERLFGARTWRDALEQVIPRNDAWWCDDKTTPQAESCAQQIDGAFARALDELQVRFGADVAAWRWRDAHVARSEHRPFSRVGPLARAFELRVGSGGDTYTVNVSRVSFRPDPLTGELYLDEHGPSLRALYDAADPARSRVMHSGGQSGLPLSRHYRDFVRPWARVEYVPLWSSEPPVATLMLQPR
jgi:penicillin amidase